MAHVSLSKPLRNALQSAAMQGRDIAEAGAREALAFYSIGSVKAPDHLEPDQRAFRNKLRAHARQLGDLHGDSGTQETARLIDEVAYEQWHRILFTRFLVENGLLIHPELEAPLSLADVTELAADEKREVWELASEFASKMLPQIFRLEDPTQQLRLPRNRVQALEKLVLSLESDTFKANDSLGWSYQFWQAKRKDAINAAGGRIGAAELPAVTQLFTEDYMVEFLLQNSLGAWFKSNHADVQLDIEMPYLRYVPSNPVAEASDGTNELVANVPAAGRFETWPKSLADFKVLDPCCGSGHFPVFLLHMLVPMRMALEDLTAADAVDAVLRDNIYGLELDPRCVEIAVFALALASWTYPSSGGYRKLPAMNIACCGLAITQKKKDWVALAGDDERLQRGMEALYLSFKDAPTLGSLLDPLAVAGDLFEAGFRELEPLLATALSGGSTSGRDDEAEAILTAQGLAKAASILSTKFDLVATNPPYLGRGNQSDELRKFCEKYYFDAKNDLANVMLERCLKLVKEGSGVIQFVMPQNWLFLPTYKKQRESLLRRVEWNLLARLGEGGFDSPQAAGAFIVLLTQTRTPALEDFELRGLEASATKSPAEKAGFLRGGVDVISVGQLKQLANPDARVLFELIGGGDQLAKYANAYWGQGTGDFARFGRFHWEIPKVSNDWELGQTTVERSEDFAGRIHVVYWEQGRGQLVAMAEALRHRLKNIHYRGAEAWKKEGVSVTLMREIRTTRYSGQIFDGNCATIVPKQSSDLPAIWCFCESPAFSAEVRKIDQKLNVTNATLLKIPFDIGHWTKVASERYPDGLPKPYSNDITQWLFHGHPQVASDPMQVALLRLLGYSWPAESDGDMALSNEGRAWIARSKLLSAHVDEDGIVCIPAVKGEKPASDRLLTLLAEAFGDKWTPSLQNELLTKVGFADKSLEAWLRDGFFSQHCKLFHDRPLIWHIWDGEKDGFSALVNYHKLTKQNLSTLTHTYLGSWLEEKKRQQTAGVDGAKELVLAAQLLQEKLKRVLVGEKPLDIFVRWKSLAEQPIGWAPDLNDGVQPNIRPLMLVGDVSKKGAGILRDRPNVKWTKDRGTDPTSAPWYDLGPDYGEDKGARINEHHTTLEEKKKARGE